MFIELSQKLLESIKANGIDLEEGDIVTVYGGTLFGLDDEGNEVDVSEHPFVYVEVENTKGKIVPTLFEISSQGKGNEVYDVLTKQWVSSKNPAYLYNRTLYKGEVFNLQSESHVKCDQPHFNTLSVTREKIDGVSPTVINDVKKLYLGAKAQGRLTYVDYMNESYSQIKNVLYSINDSVENYDFEINIEDNESRVNVDGEILVYDLDGNFVDYLIIQANQNNLYLFNSVFDLDLNIASQEYVIGKGDIDLALLNVIFNNLIKVGIM